MVCIVNINVSKKSLTDVKAKKIHYREKKKINKITETIWANETISPKAMCGNKELYLLHFFLFPLYVITSRQTNCYKSDKTVRYLVIKAAHFFESKSGESRIWWHKRIKSFRITVSVKSLTKNRLTLPCLYAQLFPCCFMNIYNNNYFIE